MNPILAFILAVIAVAIPLAWFMHIVAKELQVRKFLKMMRPTIQNVELIDSFRLHERPANVMSMRKRKA